MNTACPAAQPQLVHPFALQSTNFVLWSRQHSAQLLAVPSAGWRRPFALCIQSASSFSAAVVKGEQIVLHTRHHARATSHSRVTSCSERASSKVKTRLPDGTSDAADDANGAMAGTKFEADCSVDCNSGSNRSSGSQPVEAERAAGQPPPDGALFEGPAVTLQPPHHGKEVHAAACLLLDHGRVAAVTASEDGTVRSYIPGYEIVHHMWLRFLLCGRVHPSVSAPCCLRRCRVVRACPARPNASASCRAGAHAPEQLLVGEHAAGTAVRCLAVVALPALQRGPNARAAAGVQRRWLAVSAGAKQAHMAWMLQATPGAPLEARWLSTLPPPKGGLRPKQKRGFNSAAGERRTMALCAFVAPLRTATEADLHDAQPTGWPQTVLVISAASHAAVHVLALDLCSGAWRPWALLAHHRRPVLSAAQVSVHAGAPQPLHLAFTGATNGSVAAWDLTAVAQAAAQGAGASQCTSHSVHGQHPSSSSRRAPSANQALAQVAPVWTSAAHHQSGVNAVACCMIGADVLIVTGGDDQALRLTQLRSASSGKAWQCVGDCGIKSAHASAIKGLTVCCPSGVASTTAFVCTVGLDQVLRVWQVQAACSRASVVPAEKWGSCTAGCSAACVQLTVKLVVVHTLDVSEPSCVSSSLQRRNVAGGVPDECAGAMACWDWHLVVGGRGTQVLAVSVCA
jgi:hypothetical protein